MYTEEATYILEKAVECKNWTTILNILKRKTGITEKSLVAVLHKAQEHHEWDVVCSILHQPFYNCEYSICDILSKVVEMRNWDKVSHVISLLDASLKVDRDMVEAALCHKAEIIKKDFKKANEAERDGVRLVVAASGTSEHVAYLLYEYYVSSNREVWQCCLYLSAINNRLEILTRLLVTHRKELKYSNLSQARAKAASDNLEDTERLLKAAQEVVLKNTCY